jgi:hypothetical protein
LVGLAPGESVDIGLTGLQLENFRKFFEAIGRPKLEKVDLQFSQILFEDDTMWDLQGPFHRDPKDPARWIGKPATEQGKNHHRPAPEISSQCIATQISNNESERVSSALDAFVFHCPA